MASRFGGVLMFLSPLLALSTDLDLSNWMGQLEPVLGDSTLLDLSVPGSHDTMTYDLSKTISEGYEGMGAAISKILHTVTPIIAGGFIREQGQTQGLDIVSQLNAGVRFIDFRIMYTEKPGTLVSDHDWYNLHGCQSNHPALDGLKKVQTWLAAHPKEIVVFWVSRHGSSAPTGTKQYPNTTPEERQAFFKSAKTLFGSMMHDSTLGRVNETSISTLWKRGTQVFWYAADIVESTASSSFALDANLIDNELPGAGYGYGSMKDFRSGKSHREADKASDRFWLMSLASSDDDSVIEARAFLTFLPFIGKSGNIKTCAKGYGISGMNTCPMSLQETGQLNNYYNQIVLEGVFQEGQQNAAVDFPNAIYIDGLDVDGQIRTGTDRLNPSMLSAGAGASQQGYGYSATVIASTIRRLCRNSSAKECTSLTAAAAAARAKHPVQTWHDEAHGRLYPAPALPPASSVVV